MDSMLWGLHDDDDGDEGAFIVLGAGPYSVTSWESLITCSYKLEIDSIMAPLDCEMELR